MFNEEYCNKNSSVVQGKLRNLGVLTVKRPRDYVKKEKEIHKEAEKRGKKKSKRSSFDRSLLIAGSLTK